MATPKTDIEQSVGRILREKHSSPVVVDIVDSHDLFQNQWRKRKTFYKKENYKIIYTNSANYTPDTSKWLVVFNPSSSETKKCVKKTSKNVSVNSNSSSDKSITNDSDEEIEEEPEKPKDKYLAGVCFLKIKNSCPIHVNTSVTNFIKFMTVGSILI
jgi:superfamily II DNA or RNA helicase